MDNRLTEGELSLSITAEPVDSQEARRLIAALDAALTELHPPEQRFGPNLKAEHLEEGRGTTSMCFEKSLWGDTGGSAVAE